MSPSSERGSSRPEAPRGGVAAADPDADALLLTLCDQPDIRAEQLGTLVAAWRATPDNVAAAAYAGTRGVPAIFPARCREALARLGGDRGAQAVIAAEPDVTVVDMPEAAFDVDTPEDARRIGQCE